MCGRYGLYSRKERLERLLGITRATMGGDVLPRYNIAPRSHCWIALIREDLGPAPAFESYQWGLLPSWVKDRHWPMRAINARAETVFEKPMFRRQIRECRCLVPADGYYEWKTTPAVKIPYWFTMASGEPFFFGGIWDRWSDGESEPLPSFALLTTEPNELCSQVHDRMPVIIAASDYRLWLDPSVRGKEPLEHLLRPYPA